MAVVPKYDIVCAAGGDYVSVAPDIVSSLRHKGYCQINPRLDEAELRGAVSEIEDLEALGQLERPPALLVDGLLGNEGSAKTIGIGWPQQCPKIIENSPALIGCNTFLTDMFDSVAIMLEDLGISCTARSEGLVHETGLPEGDEAPDLKENDALPWLALLQRHRIMLLLNLSAITGTLEMNPFDADAQSYEVATPPGSLTFVRVDGMTHKHFAHSKAYMLSCFLLEEPRTQSRAETFVRQMNAIPCAKALEEWIDQRMKDLKEEEQDTGVFHKRLSLEWIHAMNKTYHVTQRVAVRGVATRCASTWDPISFYRMLHSCPDVMVEIPLTRWDVAENYDPDPECWRRNKSCVKHMSMVDGLHLFDCKFFSLSPAESQGMDVHQRFVLEGGYVALSGAGYKKGKLMNSNGGVYMGCTGSTWGAVCNSVSATGGACSITSNRFSFCLGLKGPSTSIDTDGCSGLSAIHAGAEGVCLVGRGVPNPFSLSGGLNFELAPVWKPQYMAQGFLSAQGRCFSFDQSAEGWVSSDGCGMVCLKRSEEIVDEERVFIENEPLWGMIAGSKGNNNGRCASYGAPSGSAQIELLGSALEAAALRGCDIEAAECNGEGNAMCDAVELSSLERGFRSEASFAPLALTSAKSVFGHTLWGAGAVSFIKLLLANSFGTVAPIVHLIQMNPQAEGEGQLQLMTECFENDNSDSVFSGVSARGFGGTNVYAILYGAVDEVRNPDVTAELLDRDKEKSQPFFWPGGGGELDESKTPARGYSVAGTWAQWKPQKLEDEGGGGYGLTVLLGENRYEDFHILMDGDRTKRLHPSEPRGIKGGFVEGPDEAPGALYWRIDGDVEESEVGQAYRIHFTVKGKYRGVTWEKLEGEPEPGSVPPGSFFIVGDWSCWSRSAMVQDSDSWTFEVKLLRAGGQFQILRNGDWNQVICPPERAADESAPAQRPELAEETRGLTWAIGGQAGETWRIVFLPKEQKVTWKLVKSDKLTDEESRVSRRAQFTVLGSWTDFLDHHVMKWEGQPVAMPATYSCFVKVGPSGKESFNICEEGDWERMLSPEEGVWIIGEEEDAKPGEIFKITVTAVRGITQKVLWARPSRDEVEEAVREGRVVAAPA